jgi:hypothetical protein
MMHPPFAYRNGIGMRKACRNICGGPKAAFHSVAPDVGSGSISLTAV